MFFAFSGLLVEFGTIDPYMQLLRYLKKNGVYKKKQNTELQLSSKLSFVIYKKAITFSCLLS